MLLHIVMTQFFSNSKKSFGKEIKTSYLASLFRDPPFRSIFHENWSQYLKTKQGILKKKILHNLCRNILKSKSLREWFWTYEATQGDLCIAFLVFSALQSALCYIHTFLITQTHETPEENLGFSILTESKTFTFFLKQATISAFCPFNLLKLLHFIITIATTFVLCLYKQAW